MESTELDKLAYKLFTDDMIRFDPGNRYITPSLYVFIQYKNKGMFNGFYGKAKILLRKNKINKIRNASN
jgi:hypothetical protein